MIPDSSRVEPETPWDSYALGWISANGLSGHPELPTLSERSLGHPELPTLVSPTSEPSPTLRPQRGCHSASWHTGYDKRPSTLRRSTLHRASRRWLPSRRVSEGLESPRVKLSAELENVPSTRFPEPGLSSSVDGLD